MQKRRHRMTDEVRVNKYGEKLRITNYELRNTNYKLVIHIRNGAVRECTLLPAARTKY